MSSARHAAERMLEQALIDARCDCAVHAASIISAASFPQVWWEYNGMNRRLMFAAAWEPDPAARQS